MTNDIISLVVFEEVCDLQDKTTRHYAFRNIENAKECAKHLIEHSLKQWQENYGCVLPYSEENEQQNTALYELTDDDCGIFIYENGRACENSTNIYIEQIELR